MTQQYTPAQLEAWAGLGPWEWSKETICRQKYHFLGPGVLVTTETDGTPWGDTIDQTNAALIAAAPDLARLVLEKDAEIARLKAGMAAKQWPPTNAELREMLAVVVGAWWSESSAWRLRTRELNPEDIKGMYAIRDVLAPYIARQAMKETSDE